MCVFDIFLVSDICLNACSKYCICVLPEPPGHCPSSYWNIWKFGRVFECTDEKVLPANVEIRGLGLEAWIYIRIFKCIQACSWAFCLCDCRYVCIICFSILEGKFSNICLGACENVSEYWLEWRPLHVNICSCDCRYICIFPSVLAATFIYLRLNEREFPNIC